jgi:RNA polymerase sigma-32 factor
LVDEHADQETTLAASEEFDNRRKALASALSALNDRERRIFEARRLAEEPITLKETQYCSESSSMAAAS